MKTINSTLERPHLLDNPRRRKGKKRAKKGLVRTIVQAAATIPEAVKNPRFNSNDFFGKLADHRGMIKGKSDLLAVFNNKVYVFSDSLSLKGTGVLILFADNIEILHLKTKDIKKYNIHLLRPSFHTIVIDFDI